jgi:hypothetical protein
MLIYGGLSTSVLHGKNANTMIALKKSTGKKIIALVRQNRINVMSETFS